MTLIMEFQETLKENLKELKEIIGVYTTNSWKFLTPFFSVIDRTAGKSSVKIKRSTWYYKPPWPNWYK